MKIMPAARGREGRWCGGCGLFVGIALLAVVGCDANRGQATKPSSQATTDATGTDNLSVAAGAVTTADYQLEGVVRSVDSEGGRVLIRHREIPGLMKAMTMPFRPVDESILGLLKPGDTVEGILRVEKQDGAVRDYQLRELKVTKPATPKALVLDISKGKVPLREQPSRLEVGEPVPDFAMTGQDGKPMKLSDLRGRVVVLTFIYLRCPMPDFCPLMDRKFSELAQHVNAFPKRAKDIRLISLSFDPEHDTPDLMRRHAAMRGATAPLWSFAVASHEELAKIAPRLGLIFGPDGNEISHNLCTAIVDPQGKLARLEVGTQPNRWTTADFLRTIYGLLPGGAN
jgi:protein SCO1/2